MRVCPKCSKRASDESKICRDCGAILEDIPAEEASESDDPGRPAALPVDEPQVTGEDGVSSSDDPDASEWKCPQCGEAVPSTFEVCWKCLTTKEGERVNQGALASLQQIANSEHEIDAVEQDAKDSGIDNEERLASKCPRCGSSQIMYGVTVMDQGQHSDGQLKVVVFGDPQALIFKNRLYGKLKADICGQCGHVELRVANPRQLYRHYRRSVE